LELLSENVRSNAPGARVCRLVWGSDDPLKQLGLVRKPDVVLASDVVYGNDPTKWNSLVKTMKDLCGRHTLVIVGNVQRYPVHHPMAESRFFHESTAVDFVRKEIPTNSLHPDFRRTGAGSCAVHVFRKREETKTPNAKASGEKKRQRDGGDLDGKRTGKGKKEKRRKE
jgi:predicted nicotinamide N-methyase